MLIHNNSRKVAPNPFHIFYEKELNYLPMTVNAGEKVQLKS